MFIRKTLDCGFIVVCPDANVAHLACTARFLNNRYASRPFIAVTNGPTDELSKICPSHRGGLCYQSLFNLGFRHATAPWNFVIAAGGPVPKNLDQKFSQFIESDKDILYPIVERRTNFVDATMNGLLIHRDTYRLVGNLGESNPLEICKLLWATDALALGCKFKAVAGCRVI